MARIVMAPGAYAHMDNICAKLADQVGDEVHNDVLQAVIPPMTGWALGELIESVHAVPLGKIHQVWIGTDHWGYVEYGAPPHVIVPHGNYDLKDRRRHKNFGRLVHHPGSPEQAPMRKALYQKRALKPVVGY